MSMRRSMPSANQEQWEVEAMRITTVSRRLCIVAFVALGIAVVALLGTVGAAGDLGPAVGTKAPDIGTRLDQDGKKRNFASLVGRNGLVLMFNRSAGWCPYCQAQMIELNGGIADIEKRGFRVVVLTYDAPDVLKGFATKRGIKYALVSDPKSQVIDAYKLRDPQYAAGHRAHGVPRPITFILDRNGVIKAKLFEETYRVRPPVAAILAKLDEVGPRS
jgi:peroxiredoxin